MRSGRESCMTEANRGRGSQMIGVARMSAALSVAAGINAWISSRRYARILTSRTIWVLGRMLVHPAGWGNHGSFETAGCGNWSPTRWVSQQMSAFANFVRWERRTDDSEGDRGPAKRRRIPDDRGKPLLRQRASILRMTVRLWSGCSADATASGGAC